MKTIIVDDEPRAIDLLKTYSQHFSWIEICGTFRNALKAFDFLSKEEVELVFLDINMPHLSGISLSRMIAPNIKVIFTTAYSEYAAESYEVQAIDYLLKPISLERFAKAIAKVMAQNKPVFEQEEESIVWVKSGAKLHRIKADDILYLEKDGNYVTYHLEAGNVLGRESILESLNKLPVTFIQTHRSFIINTTKVSYLEGETLVIQGQHIPIGNTHKADVLKRLMS